MLAIEQLHLVLEEIDHLRQITPKNQALLMHPAAERIKKIENAKLIQILKKLGDEGIIKIHKLPQWDNPFAHLLNLNPTSYSAHIEIPEPQKFQNQFKKAKQEVEKWNKSKTALISDAVKAKAALWISYSPRDREIVLNDIFLLSKPFMNPENDLVMEYLFQNPNRKISRKELEQKATVGKIKKKFHAIMRDLGFTKDLLALFFTISKDTITFHNPISHLQFQNSKISKIKITAR